MPPREPGAKSGHLPMLHKCITEACLSSHQPLLSWPLLTLVISLTKCPGFLCGMLCRTLGTFSAPIPAQGHFLHPSIALLTHPNTSDSQVQTSSRQYLSFLESHEPSPILCRPVSHPWTHHCVQDLEETAASLGCCWRGKRT